MSNWSTTSRSLEEVVILEVGRDDKPARFTVHQNILSAASPFFEAACTPKWMKSEDRVIKLPEDDPDAIRVFIYWAYHDNISVSKGLPDSTTNDSVEEASKTAFGLFAKLYILAEKYQILRLMNDVVDATISNVKEQHLPMATVSYIYENTLPGLPGLPFRRLMLDIVLQDYSATCIEESAHLMCRDFLVDLSISLRRGDNVFRKYGNQDTMPARKICGTYHIHVGGTETCRKAKPVRFYDLEEI
jgi:BTB/POZ domain